MIFQNPYRVIFSKFLRGDFFQNSYSGLTNLQSCLVWFGFAFLVSSRKYLVWFGLASLVPARKYFERQGQRNGTRRNMLFIGNLLHLIIHYTPFSRICNWLASTVAALSRLVVIDNYPIQPSTYMFEF